MRGTDRSHQQSWLAAAILICAFLIGAVTVSAQSGIPVSIGQNVTGEVTADVTSVIYTIEVAASQSITLQVLAITPGFAPTFRVSDPSGVVILDAANPGTLTIAQGSPNLEGGVLYIIEVTSANGTAGQFLISVQPGAPLAPPQPLTPGAPLSGSVDAQTTRQAYSFSGVDSDVLLVTVRGDAPNAGPVVTLRDADSGDLLGLTSGRLGGARYRIPALTANYLLEVTHSGASIETFSVCLETESGSIPCPGSSVAGQPTEVAVVTTPEVEAGASPTFAQVAIDPNGACMVVSLQGVTINVRSGPSTNNNIVGRLAPTETALVIGRLPDNSWYQVNVGGGIGWVSATVVRAGGNCAGVPISQPATPPAATSEVSGTETPTATFTATPTNTPSSGGTVGHLPPISALTLVGPIQIVPINSRLDYTRNPNYGEANLSAGFSPDPYSVGMTTGGNVDVSYLGSSCSGFATTAPDLRINFGGGGSPLLRIYFVGANGDATMIVNDPYGNFYCVDDSFGTVNPTIDFNNPSGGTYDIWIGSYAASTTVSGTLYISENSGNHP